MAIVKTGHEKKVAERFHDNGIEHFLPMIRKRRSTQPMFPSYMFAHAASGFRKILITSGVLDFIRAGDGKPALVRQSIVDGIRMRCDADGVEIVDRPSFVPGQKVQIVEGVFEGWQGTIGRMSDQKRIEVLLSAVTCRFKVYVDEEALTAA